MDLAELADVDDPLGQRLASHRHLLDIFECPLGMLTNSLTDLQIVLVFGSAVLQSGKQLSV